MRPMNYCRQHGINDCTECFKAAEDLAEKFHTLYEKFAPEYGYKTREASAVPWADVPENNKQLMIRVCSEILQGV